MKKIILMLIFATVTISGSLNADEKGNSALYLKRAVWGTVAVASSAALVPAVISDLKAHPGTAQAEIPLCIIPLGAFMLSYLMYEHEEINPE